MSHRTGPMQHRVFLNLVAFVLSQPALAWEDFAAYGGPVITASQRLHQPGNPAALALNTDPADLQFAAPAGMYEGRHWDTAVSRLGAAQQSTSISLSQLQQVFDTLPGLRYGRRFAAGGQFALPHMPIALAAHTYGGFEEQGRFGQPVILPSLALDFPQVVYGVSRIDSGVTLSKVVRETLGGTQRLALGLRAQLVSLSAFYTRAQVWPSLLGGAGDASVAHPPRTRFDDSGFNLDLGVLQEIGYEWKWGLWVRDWVARDVPFGASGDVYRLRPQATAGVAWQRSPWRWAMDVDLNRAPGYGFVAGRQRVVSGVEYAIFKAAHVNTGLSTNLADTSQTCGSLGLGWGSAWVDLNVGLRTCMDRTQGIAAAFALKL